MKGRKEEELLMSDFDKRALLEDESEETIEKVANECGVYERQLRRCHNLGCYMCDLGIQGYRPFNEYDCYEHMKTILKRYVKRQREKEREG